MQRHRATPAQAILLALSFVTVLSIWLGGCTTQSGDDRPTLPSEVIDEPDTDPDDATDPDDSESPDPSNYSINAEEDESVPGKWSFEIQSRSAPPSGLQFVWDFGDGQTSTGMTQSHLFNTPGTHHIVVRAFNARGGLEFTLTLDVEVPAPGLPPVANAGGDFSVVEGDFVVLDGNLSSDPDSTDLTYSWSQIGGGQPVALSGANSSVATFTAPDVTIDTVFQFTLTVSDGANSSQDVILVSVTNLASASFGPTAHAGADQEALAGDLVFLDGSGSAGSGAAPLQYQWTQLSGPAVTLVGHASAIATFTVQSVTPPSAVLQFRLTVLQDGLVAEDDTQVTVYPATLAPPPSGGGGGGGGTGGGGGGTGGGGTGGGTGDQCPTDPNKTVPGQCGCGEADTDSDGDGVADCVDDCPNHPGKSDPGLCGCSTADTDTDGDGTPNCLDMCPTDPDKVLAGTCGCGNSDVDSDLDGVKDCRDGCPTDGAKTTPGLCGCGTPDADSDGDGALNCNDGCPNHAGKTSPGVCGCATPDVDLNGNGTPDCNDNCGVGVDTDGDGTTDCVDGCPNDPNKTAPGICGCSVPDTDTDSDGTANCNDLCPNHAGKTSPGVCGCAVPDTDTDADGTPNCADGCPNDPAKITPGICGCGNAETDGDGDGAPNCVDGCPNDPNKASPGTCGCGVSDADSDGDGRANCQDGCPNDPNKFAPGACGCGVAETDTDSDGTPNCIDGCPNDFRKTAPGLCGCGVLDLDSDFDGTPNCNDACPNDPTKLTPGVCGCGTSDADANGNGTADCLEVCGSNPVLNPGFESGATAWQNVGHAGRSVVITQFHGGTKSLEIQVSSQFARDVSQTVSAAAGNTYDLAAWVRTSGISGQGAALRVDWLNSTGAIIRTDVTNALFGTTNWTQLFATLVAPATTTQAQINLRLETDTDGVGLAWFDDVVLCDRGAQDSDGDGVTDALDSHPNDPRRCRDGDADGCDDCAITTVNPANDGPDSDGDGVCNTGDACPGHDDNQDTDGDGIPDGCEPPALCVNPTSINFGSSTSQITFHLWNCGSGTLNYTLSDDAAWLTVAPTGGSSVGEQDAIVASVSRTGLANNTYTGTITVTPSVGTIVNILVSMTVAQSGTGSPVVQFSATRTSGVSPLGVVFDATGTTSPGTTRPFHELDYTWDFGDPGSTFVNAKSCSGTGMPCDANSDCGSGQTCSPVDANKAKGAIAAHVFELPAGTTSKTYTVTLTVKRPNGQSAQATRAITVSDFTGHTFYVSDSSGNDANTGLSQTAAFKSWDKAISVLFLSNGPRRALFKRGDTFTAPTAFAGSRSIGNKIGPFIIGAYGSGAKPVILTTHGSTTLEMKNSVSDARIVDVTFRANNTAADLFSIGSDGMLLRTDIDNHHRGISNAFGQRNNVMVVDCHFGSTFTSYPIYFSSGSGFPASKYLTLMANRFDGTTSHLVRIYTTRTLVYANRFGQAGASRDQLKFVGLVAPEKVEYSILSSNLFLDPGAAAWMVSIGPQNTSSQEQMENVIVERNVWDVSSDGKVALQSRGASEVTVRNNVFKGARTCISPSAPVHQFSQWDKWDIVNNTAYRGSGNDFSFLQSSDASQLVTNMSIRNNIISVPTANGLIYAVELLDAPLAQVAESNNIWYIPTKANSPLFKIGGNSLTFSAWGSDTRGSKMLDPLFVSAGQNLKLQASSPAINAGMVVPGASDDFQLANRPKGSTFDMGAYEIN